MRYTVNLSKKYINHATVASYLNLIIEKMSKDDFIPDIIVGLSRGGLVPGIMLSHFLGKPFVPIEASLRDHPSWNTQSENFLKVEKICIVDDICDSGDTFKKLKQDILENYKGLDARFCCLHYNKPSNFSVDWYGTSIDKDKKDVWLVYPWEDWWTRDAVESPIINSILENLK